MKKAFLFSMALFTVLCMWADADIQKGSMRDLKDANARIFVTWDYSKMLIEDMEPSAFLKEKGPDWERDYPAEVAAGESTFTVFFNKKSKKYAQVTDDEEAAQYEMVIHVDKFHYGSTGAAIMFGGFARGASIEGTAEVIEVSSKNVICVIDFECSGAAALGNEARRVLAYQDLAQDLAKLVSKGK